MTRRQFFVLLATIIGSGVVFLDGSIVNLALPHIARDFHSDFASLQWIVDGYLLSLSALILLGGSLGDILGRKRMYLTGLLGFGAASLLCGLAPNSEALIAIRILQGVFGALLVPGGLAIINTNFPSKLRGMAIGRWTAWSAITTAIGPLLGGYLVDNTSWRWIFFINLPLIALSATFAWLGVKESRDPSARRIDFTGAILAMFALSGLIYGLIEGPAHHWNATTLLSLIVGAVLSAIFLLKESRSKDPMLPLSLFGSRNFSAANVTTFAMYGALGGFFFVLLVFLQTIAGYSTAKAGASIIPVTIVLLLLSSRVGHLSAKRGPRLFMTLGPLIAGLGMALLIPLGKHASYFSSVFPGVLLFSFGLALTVAPLTTTVMTSVPETSSGIASAINNAVSRVAGLVVVALLGLFGAAHAYRFATILCASLAILAGLLSWAFVRNQPILKKTKA